MIEAFAAKSGFRSLRIDGIALHSPYDPVREAHRFVREGIGADAPSTVVVLGEGLGYVGDAVRDLFPSCRIISVLYSVDVSHAAGPAREPTWIPGRETGLAEFLLQHLGELDVEGLRVIEWPPSARLFPGVSRDANVAVHQVVQQLNGSLVTTIASGRLWIRNTVENFLAFDTVLVGRPSAQDRPVLVAAPGPSLEAAARVIRDVLPFVDLWALPSSLPLLLEEGLPPDLVVMTDPGYYSMHHLSFAAPSCPIAMPMSAARGAWGLPGGSGRQSRAPFLLAQSEIVESAILEGAGMDAPRVPPHGTVAATALDLARASTRAPVIVAGLDLCARDVAFHARPNAFDTLLHLRASRVAPHGSLAYERSEEQHADRVPGAPGFRASLSLRTYAGWFDQAATGDPRRVFRLLPSPVPLGTMRDLDSDGLRDLVARGRRRQRGPLVRPRDPYPNRKRRREIVDTLISGWVESLQNASAEIGGDGGLAALSNHPSARSLAFEIQPRLLLEARRKSRQGDAPGARKAAVQMLEDCAAFLRALREKTRVAG